MLAIDSPGVVHNEQYCVITHGHGYSTVILQDGAKV